MRPLIALMLVAIGATTLVGDTAATEVTRETLEGMSKHFRYFITLEADGDKPLRFLYADSGPHLHLYTVSKGRVQLDWESTNLGTAVTSLMVRDLNKDGVESILVSTIGGRLVGFDAQTYERNFENFQEPFDRIQCLVAENINDTVQDEIILIGKRAADRDSRLYIFDSVSGALIHQSQDPFTAVELLVANVDDDPQPEIILNTGIIYDTRFYRIEPAEIGEGAFGVRMRLMDINGDGIPEIFGELPGFQLRVYDIYAHRELF